MAYQQQALLWECESHLRRVSVDSSSTGSLKKEKGKKESRIPPTHSLAAARRADKLTNTHSNLPVHTVQSTPAHWCSYEHRNADRSMHTQAAGDVYTQTRKVAQVAYSNSDARKPTQTSIHTWIQTCGGGGGRYSFRGIWRGNVKQGSPCRAEPSQIPRLEGISFLPPAGLRPGYLNAPSQQHCEGSSCPPVRDCI